MLEYLFNNFQLYDLVFFFIIYAFIGWVLETVYASIEDKHFVNRGFLSGPFCPIYGFGAVLLIVALHPVINNLFLLFIGAVVLTSVLEYLTGWVLEKAFDHKWWDYSNRRFNLQGRICLRFSLYWGVIAVAMLKLLHPEVIKFVQKIPYQFGLLVIYGLSLYLLIDFIHTLVTVIRLKATLGEIQHLALEGRERLEHIKESSAEGIEETKAELRARYEMLAERLAARNKRLLKAFPNLKKKRIDHLLLQLKEFKDRWNQADNRG